MAARSRARECPFCGTEARVWTRTVYDRRVNKEMERTTVLCPECGCRTRAFTRPGAALAAWNRRFSAGAKAARPWWARLMGGR